MAGSNLVRSLTRGLAILQTVAESDGGLSLSDLSARLELKPTTVHNLARTLVARGFLIKTRPGPRYKLGTSVSELSRMHEHSRLIACGSEVISGLFRRINRGVIMLAVNMGDEIVARLRVRKVTDGIVERPLNWYLAPYLSGGPLVFQAYWGSGERAEYRRRHPFAEMGTHAWGTLDKFDEALRKARAQGYVAHHEEATGHLVLGVPVFGEGGEVIAVISHGTVLEDITPELEKQWIEALCDAGKELTALMAVSEAEVSHASRRWA